MIKSPSFFLICIVIFLVTGCSGNETNPQPTLDLTSCELRTLGSTLDAQCTSLQVPENYAEPNGRQIEISIAVLPAESSLPETDPIFLLAGGPGQAAIETFPFIISQLDELNQARDIVLVDQRGTGSSNPLDCTPFLDELELDADEADVFEKMDECRQTLTAENDLTQYVTDIAMRDLDNVRENLGYEQINLIGTSYGSRAAQRYMALYPDRVRTAVLNAVTSSELILQLQAPQDGQRALENLWERCQADTACQDAFPELETTVNELIAMVNGGIQTEITHPTTAAKIEITMDEKILMRTVFNLMYSAELVSILPLMLTETAESGDFSALIGQSLLISDSANLYQGMFYAVACSEDALFMDAAEAEISNDETLFPAMATTLKTACEEWPIAELSQTFRQPLESDIPTLLLSGDSDPITPPSYAEDVLTGLPNGRHIVVPHYGHDVLTVGCMPTLVTEFIGEASAENLEDDCLSDITPPPFFVSPTGPAP